MNRLPFSLNREMELLARELDLTPTQFEKARQRYTSLGDYFNKQELPKESSVQVFPQGSMRIGTTTKPFANGEDCDYDVDIVCKLQLLKNDISAELTKNCIGNILKASSTYFPLLEKEGRRCWTLTYREEQNVGYHMDILPAVSDSDERIIHHTHKENEHSYDWYESSPEAFAEWFELKNSLRLQNISTAQRQKLFEISEYRKTYSSVEQIPSYFVKTPLQQSIQLLKRHRDVYFSKRKNSSNAPSSIIITTLAANIYNSEESLLEALQSITSILTQHAKLIDDSQYLISDKQVRFSDNLIKREFDEELGNFIWKISNPVNSHENYANQWHENDDQKAKEFFKWLLELEKDMTSLLEAKTLEEYSRILSIMFGEHVINYHFNDFGNEVRTAREENRLYSKSGKLGISESPREKDYVKQHTFYGSIRLRRLPSHKGKYRSIQHATNLNSDSRTIKRASYRNNEIFKWEGNFQPTDVSNVYQIRIELTKRYYHPIITIIKPTIPANEFDEIPHVYKDTQSLCLFYNEWDRYNDQIVDILPWIDEWLLNYELWKITGTWLGGGYHEAKEA